MSSFLAFTLHPEELSLPYSIAVGVLRLYFSRINTHLFPVRSIFLKFYHSINQGEDGIVFAKPHILSSMKLGSALANDDGTGLGNLVAVNLDTEALALRVAAILGASRSLLVRVLDDERAAAWEADEGGGAGAERSSGEGGRGRR